MLHCREVRCVSQVSVKGGHAERVDGGSYKRGCWDVLTLDDGKVNEVGAPANKKINALSESETLDLEKYRYKLQDDMETDKERLQAEKEIKMRQMDTERGRGAGSAVKGVNGSVHHIPEFTQDGTENFFMQFERIATMKELYREDWAILAHAKFKDKVNEIFN